MARKIKRALIVVPLSIVNVWQEELQKFAAFPYNAVILEGTMNKKQDALEHMKGEALQIVIINYESAWRMETGLLKFDADIIIADEGHKIKTHSTRQSKALHKLGAKARYRMLLTGTVITNKAIDIFSQYKFINPGIFGESFYAFRSRYFDMMGYGNHTPVLKKSMEQELMDRLHSIAFRITKAECLDLPETTDIVRHIKLEASAEKIYRSLVKDSYAELSKGEVTVTNVLTRLLRLSQLTGGFIGNDRSTVTNVSTAKLEALSDVIEEAINQDKKIVVIARFVAEIKAIEKLLQKKKLEYSLIMGGVKDREIQVSQFQNTPEVKVFIGQIATAGLGITLTAASTMVFYSMDYSMSNFEQTKARIHRVGQKENCTYIYLVARGTVDEKVLKALRSKADLARILVDEYIRGDNPFVYGGESDRR
ncbi:DEAD/DEAH box helicase [Ruminiclostridium papyrosolvens]|uniref:DEAD/DEAH box helicase n=1 Tax=Ruminiclostridium papyrosolvens TaxID=29362 RepID=UPI001FA73E5D|nr:DEAD/DEAH box helicase [Ruminiclostridium papyrosolvens]